MTGSTYLAAGPKPGRTVWGLVLLAPALLLLAALFVVPAAASVVSAFTDKAGALGLANFRLALSLYWRDVLFTAAVVCASVAATAVLSAALAGALTVGEGLTTRLLAWLYRWPLFIPMVCVGQLMRGFLARNGMLNNALVWLGVLDRAHAVGLADWRGLLISFVWKQVPFVTLMLAGAMAALDRSMLEAARNLGAGPVRVVWTVLLPQVTTPLLVGCVLSFVTLMSVLSVPLMLTADSPTMLTVDMAYRITTFADYGVANALGVVSYLITAVAAVAYLRHGARAA